MPKTEPDVPEEEEIRDVYRRSAIAAKHATDL